MKPASLKQKFAYALVLPLLGLLCLVLRNASTHSFTPASTTKPTASVRSLEPKAATTAAIHQLKQDGSYDSLQQVFQAALAQPEPVRSAPADIVSATHTMATPWRGLRSYFGPEGVQVRPSQSGDASWTWNARLVSYGHGQVQLPVEPATAIATKAGVEYRRGALTEWYLNDRRGLEQGFTVQTRPETETPAAPRDPLTVTLRIDTALTPKLNEAADSVAFVGKQGEPVLHYAGLLAWDATGERLAARIELRPHGALALLVDDRTATYPVTIDPILYVETQLVPSDAQPFEFLGSCIAMDDQTVVVGSQSKEINGVSGVGAVYVFVRQGTTWIQQQTLVASDGGNGDFFAQSVAVRGDTLVVGTSNFSFEIGAVYIFQRAGGVWTETQKLMASDAKPDEFFGQSVGLNGDELAIGAPGADTATGFNAGAVYLFARTGGVWSEQAKLTPNDPAAGDIFGGSLVLSNDTLIVGAEGVNSGLIFNTGAVYIFARSGPGWIQETKIASGDSLPGDRFGTSVALSGDAVAVGAPFASGQTGAVYLYRRGPGFWLFDKKLTAVAPSAGDAFGFPVGFAEGILAVGAPHGTASTGIRGGVVTLYARANAWALVHELTPAVHDTGYGFGAALAIYGDSIATTAQVASTTAGFQTGAAYVFENASVADLLVSQSADKTSVKQNDILTYTLTVQNFGANRAANVIVNDTLPSGTVYKSAQANRGNFTAPPVNQTGVVTWYLGDMFNGTQESAQLVVTVTVKGKATLTNTATVQSDSFDPNLANNTSSLATSVGSGNSGGGSKK